MNLVAKLPWWAGLVLAIAAWVFFGRLGMMQPDMSGLGRGGAASSVFSAVVPALGRALQYVIPLLCVVAAFLSWGAQRRRKGLVDTVTRSEGAGALNGMTWREFEMLVGEAFRMQGYAVAETGGSSPDGGVDLTLRKGTDTFLVQCKQWKAFKVDVRVVRELYGVMAASGAAGGFVVTSGSFTSGAVEFARGQNVKLVDGEKLYGLLQQAKTSLAGNAANPDPLTTTGAPATAPAVPSAPPCPKCGSTMVRRAARTGTRAGSEFWGCSRFPRCRGTR